MNPWTVLTAIAGLAIIYVLLPVALTTFARFRRQQDLLSLPWRRTVQ